MHEANQKLINETLESLMKAVGSKSKTDPGLRMVVAFYDTGEDMCRIVATTDGPSDPDRLASIAKGMAGVGMDMLVFSVIGAISEGKVKVQNGKALLDKLCDYTGLGKMEAKVRMTKMFIDFADFVDKKKKVEDQ
jgi:hypothetical protein